MYRPKDEVVPGYALLKFLGRGGFGEVWQAYAPGGVPVAVKIINLADDQGFKEFRAINLFRTLKHPNLVPLLSIWLKDDEGNTLDNSSAQSSVSLRSRATEMLIIMGLGDKSLRDRLKECRAEGLQGIAPRELLRYMEDAAKALDYLNEPVHNFGRGGIVGIQHCDIKPANILIVGRQAQVCDFGVARLLGEHARATTGAFAPAYVAPEMIENKPCRQTDQYSLAISYVELRTGVAPVPTNDVTSAILAHKTGQLDLSRLPPGEQEIIRKAAAIDPGRRYENCEEMVEELKAAYRAQVGISGITGSGPHAQAIPGGDDPSDALSRSGPPAGKTEPRPASAAVVPTTDPAAPATDTRVPSNESTDDPYGTMKVAGKSVPGPIVAPHKPAPPRSVAPVHPARRTNKAKLAIAAAGMGIVLAVIGFVIFQIVNADKNGDDRKPNGDVTKGPAVEVQKLIDGNNEDGFRQAAGKLSEIKDADKRKTLHERLETRWLALADKGPVEKQRKQLSEIAQALNSDRARQRLLALERPEWAGRVEQLLAKGDVLSSEAAWDELSKHREGQHKELAQKFADDLEPRWLDAITKTADAEKHLPLLERMAQKTGSKKATEEIARIKGPDLLIKDTLATLTKAAALSEAEIDRASKGLDGLTKHAAAGKRAADLLAVLADFKKNAAHLPKSDPADLLTYVWLDVTGERLKNKKALEEADRQALLTVNRLIQEQRLKQLDDLFRSAENSRSVYRASVLRAEHYRGKSAPAPADRLEAVASYQKARDVALALLRDAPPPDFADEVFDTLIARLDDKALLGDAPAEPLRQGVARLYAGAGKLIAADVPTWSAVKKLGVPGKKLIELYTQAHRIAPDADNLVLKVFAETEERLRDRKPLSDAEIEQLGKHAEEAVRTGPELEVGYNLHGYTLLLRSGGVNDYKERQNLLAQALKEFETSDAKLKKKVGDTTDEQITLNVYRSVVSLSVGVTQIDKPAEQEVNLRNAVKYAEEAVKLGDRRVDAREALAAAHEAVARTFGETGGFAEAERAYNAAIAGNTSTTQLKPFVGRGRCRYFWATHLTGEEKDAKLKDAETDLGYVVERAKGGFDAVEALEYRARVAREKAGAGEVRKATLAKAGQDLADALAIVQAPDRQNAGWKEALLIDLGYLEFELARLNPKDSAERKQHLQNAAKHAADLQPLSPVYSAILLAQVRDEEGKRDEGWFQVFKRDVPAGRLQDRDVLIGHFTHRARVYLDPKANDLTAAEADAREAVKLDVKGETNPLKSAPAHGVLGFVKFQQGRSETAKAKRTALMTEATAEFLAAIRAEETVKKRHADAWLWRYLLARAKVDETAGNLPASEVLKYLEEAEKTPQDQLSQTLKDYPAVGTNAEVRREMTRLHAALRK